MCHIIKILGGGVRREEREANGQLAIRRADARLARASDKQQEFLPPDLMRLSSS